MKPTAFCGWPEGRALENQGHSLQVQARQLLQLSVSYRAGGFVKSLFCAGGVGSATLRHVAIPAAASSQLLQGLLHQCAHVVRQAGSLGEDQRGLRSAASQQRHCFVEANQLLREHFDEAEIAVSEELNDQFLAAATGHVRLRIEAGSRPATRRLLPTGWCWAF